MVKGEYSASQILIDKLIKAGPNFNEGLNSKHIKIFKERYTYSTTKTNSRMDYDALGSIFKNIHHQLSN